MKNDPATLPGEAAAVGLRFMTPALTQGYASLIAVIGADTVGRSRLRDDSGGRSTAMARKSFLMLLAGGAALLAGALFLLLPGHDWIFERWIGAVWLVTGILFLAAWAKRRPTRL